MFQTNLLEGLSTLALEVQFLLNVHMVALVLE
jgi:hypothetical protein